jgi:hypothetical protein
VKLLRGQGWSKSLGSQWSDTALVLTQTKNSIFQIEFKWQALKVGVAELAITRVAKRKKLRLQLSP